MATEDVDEVSVSQLVQAVIECKKYSFLIGAGTSRPEPAGIPTGGELVNKWRKECYNNIEPDTEFDEWVSEKEDSISEDNKYGYWFEERHPTRGQRREFIQELVDKAEPTLGHILIATMMNEGYIPHVLTPNFDDLLFDAFYMYLEDRPNLVDHRAVAPEFKLTRRDPTIVKLHGDYLYDNLQNTDEETYSLEPAIKEVLQQTVNEYGLVVAGYSGTDNSIMEPLLDADLSEYGVYWCTRSPDKLSDEVKELLEKPNTYLVEIDGFINLMTQFGRQLDGTELPSRDELIDRAETRADKLEGVLEESQETAAGEEEEEFINNLRSIEDAKQEIENRNYQEAIEVLDRVISSGTADARAYFNRGHAKSQIGKHREAIDDYSQAIDFGNENSSVYNNRGLSKSEVGQYEDAIRDYNEAIKLDPENEAAYNNRGLAKASLGKLDEAIQDFDEAVNINPGYITPVMNKSEIRIQNERYEQAKKDAIKAKSIAESTKERATALMLEIIARTVLDEDTSELEQYYRELCEQEFTTSWSSRELDDWMETTDIEDEKEKKIRNIMSALEEHKTIGRDMIINSSSR
ncbi:tetratricopeptide repeat protein [Halomicrobium salinisoli]|uniref:tetratricopeptide repeat protein n=1 Tax=Halomicrobium salinisoli TaxID=2878391 RepID=UPI001CF0A39C|nr:tetratricopeptide repeat protein [Halomicrobium salinisoli]